MAKSTHLVLLPMAMESPPLLDTMIACASSYLALCRSDLHVKVALTQIIRAHIFGLVLHYRYSNAGVLPGCVLK